VAEIFVGKMPGQNTPATTTMATIEQGLKVFTAIYKRIYRSLGKEYQKLFRLNSLYTDDQVYFTINEPEGPKSQVVSKQDYSDSISVKPNADPNVVSSAQKLMKVQSYGPLIQLGTINVVEYTKRFLEATETENISAIINPNPPPSPEAQKAQAEMQQLQAQGALKAQEAQQKAQFEALKAHLDARDKEMDLRIKMFEAQLAEREAQLKMFMMQAEHRHEMEAGAKEHNLEMAKQVDQHRFDMTAQAQTHGQERRQQEEAHQQKIRHTEKEAEIKAKAKEKEGSTKK
jgi:hypothetical protein